LVPVLTLAALTLARSGQAKSPEAGPPLSRLPLKDRCSVAELVAKQVREVAEMAVWGKRVIVDGGLNLLISSSNNDDDLVPIFGAKESCGKMSVSQLMTIGQPIAVSLAAGSPDSLKEGWYVVISSKAVGPSRWELTWRTNHFFHACKSEPGSVPNVCPGSASTKGPAPVMRIRIGREHGESALSVTEAILVMTRFSVDQ
jgi:hypothetical protein